MIPPVSEDTLPAVLRRRFREAPDAEACTLVFPDSADRSYSFREFFTRCCDFRESLRAALPEEGGLVCVCLYHSLDLLAAFVGGFLAGQIPAMVAPPSPRMEARKYSDSFAKILEHLHPNAFVTNAGTLRELQGFALEDAVRCRMICAEDVPGRAFLSAAGEFPGSDADPDAIVLLQHSSGTTGLQKGVALSHRAVLTQVNHYASVLKLAGSDRIVSWLPLYHDMGLIACFLLPLLSGIPFVQMSPFDWVRRPGMLFDAISRYRATLCFQPNFSYDFLSSSIRASRAADLSCASMRGFINCSEPVAAASHRRFLQRFESAGVTAEKLWSCYAMAENVFAVTQSPVGGTPGVDRVLRSAFVERHVAQSLDAAVGGREGLEFVSCGRTIPGTELEVRDDAGQPCAERVVGEILIRGDSLFEGYYRREDLSGAAFAEGGWFRTGDLGYLAGGELYVTGRKKDLIIVQGRKFYPADIEAVVSQVAGIIPGRVVAFGMLEERIGTESIVVLAETQLSEPAQSESLQSAIREEVAQQLDCTLGQIHLLPPRWLVKSTSGKIARGDSRNKFVREAMQA